MTLRIYHNPRCSKSRATLELLRQHGVEPEIVKYLETPPDRATLEALAAALGGAAELVRSGEAAYRELGLDAATPDHALLDAIVEQPILLQRPIVVRGDRAAIGRPPENVLQLIGD